MIHNHGECRMNVTTGDMTCSASADESRREMADSSIANHVVKQIRSILMAWSLARTGYEKSYYMGELAHSLNELAKHCEDWASYMARWEVPSEDD